MKLITKFWIINCKCKEGTENCFNDKVLENDAIGYCELCEETLIYKDKKGKVYILNEVF